MKRESDEPRGRAGLFFCLSALLLASGVWAIWDEVYTRRPWKRHQAEFAVLTGEPIPVHVRQVVNPQLGIVDRCPSCHLATERAGFEDQEEPLRTHPRADELLGKHPPERFGCTACHAGQGLALTAGTAHGDEDPHWLEPLVAPPALEARCAACHPGDEPLAGAPHLSRGRELFRERGCGGCHAVGDQPVVRMGPSLRGAGGKLRREWLLAWLANPRQWREHSRMPSFWPEPLTGEAQAEMADVAAFLLAERPLEPIIRPGDGDSKAGRALFDAVGCRACHILGGEGDDEGLTAVGAEDGAAAVSAPRVDFGPALGRLTRKTNAVWLDRWLTDPKAVWAEASMPRFRLGAQQRADLIAFLTGLGDKTSTGSDRVPAALRRADPAEGKRLVLSYGCGGCHELPGTDGGDRVGPELDEYGTKAAAYMDFGEHPPPLKARTWEAFTRVKLARPRAMSRADIQLTMPDFQFDADDVRDLSIFLRSLRRTAVPDALVHQPPAALTAQLQAERLLDAANCRGCHVIGESGGTLAPLFADPAAGPPTLVDLHTKVQPAWLFRFLRTPRVMRPWLAVQMPDFGLSRPHAAQLAAHLSAGSPTSPYADLDRRELSTEERALGASLIKMLRCKQCHGKSARPGLKTGDYAPDLALVRSRLLPSWVVRFVTEPQAVIANTRMPSFFPDGQTPLPDVLGGDAARQIRLMTDLFYDPTFSLEEAPK